MRGDNLSSLSALDGDGSDSVMCMVTDIEKCQKNNLAVPFSTTARSLLEEVALQFGYGSGSFDLRYTDPQGVEHFLNNLGHQPLAEVCSSWAKKSKKNQFFVLHIHDGDLPSGAGDDTQPSGAALPPAAESFLGTSAHYLNLDQQPLAEESSSWTKKSEENQFLALHGPDGALPTGTGDVVQPSRAALLPLPTAVSGSTDPDPGILSCNGELHTNDVAAEGTPDGGGDAVYNIGALYPETPDNQVNVNVDGYNDVPLGPVAPRGQPPDYNSAVYSSRYGESSYNPLPKSETGFVGLVNQAMTCYLNSLLQTLFMTPEFRNTLYSWEFDYKDDEMRSIPFQLQKLFLTLQTSNKRAVETTAVTKSFGWDGSEVWQQHDVQELCHVMFDALEEKWKGTTHSEVINSLYRGRMKDYVKCLQCNNESARSVIYLDISLAIKPFGSSRAFESVEEALQAFVEPETLQGTDQYFCEKCNRKCDAHKGLKFITFPYLLTLQLKRFDFDASTYQRIKLNDRMTFPEMLDLSSFVQLPADAADSCSARGSVAPTPVDTPTGMTPAAGAGADDSAAEPGHCHCGDSAVADSTPAEAARGQLSPGNPSKGCGVVSSCRAADDEGIDISCSSSSMSLKGDSSSEAPSEQSLQSQSRQDEVTRTEEPWMYELFSVMVHSGNALGGHYYAYIKSFDDNEFYSFNDQQVTKVTLDDVMRSCGGAAAYGSRSSYSAANAYMLMYRRVDKRRNAGFVTGLPRHIEKLQQRMRAADEHDELQRELSRNTCRLRLFCHVPPSGGATAEPPTSDVGGRASQQGASACLAVPANEGTCFVTCCESATMRGAFIDARTAKRRAEFKLDVHKDKSLHEATDAAYELAGLSKLGVRRECVRLVQYNEMADAIEKSYEGEDEACVAKLFGGVKSTYHFSLLLETKKSSDSFLSFVSGGLMLKVYIIDAQKSRLQLAINVPATLQTTVKELYSGIAKCHSECSMAANVKFRGLAVHNDNIIHGFLREEATLQEEGFCKGSLVFVEEMPADGSGETDWSGRAARAPPPSYESRLHGIVDTLVCTVALEIGLPSERALLASLAREKRHEALHRQEFEQQQQQQQQRAESLAAAAAAAARLQSVAEAEEDDRAARAAASVAAQASVSASPEGAAAGCAELLAAAPQAAHSCCDGAEPFGTSWRRHVEITLKITEGTRDRAAVVHADKRLSVAELKQALEQFAGAPSGQLRLFRVFSSGQEMECQARPLDKVSSICDDLVLVAKVGRAPAKGEIRVKVFPLDLSGHAETAKGHVEVVLPHGMLVRTLQAIVADEINMAEPGSCFHVGSTWGRNPEHKLPVSADRCRLFKKSFLNPGQVLQASHKLGVDVHLFNNCELFLELLDEPDTHRGKADVAIFIQRWMPSKCDLGRMQSVVLPADVELKDIVAKISAISGIPTGRVSIGKTRSSFPGTADMGLADIHTRISWLPCLASDETAEGDDGGVACGGSGRGTAGSSWSSPTLFVDDGCVLLYRDEQEKMLELTNEKRREIQQKDEGRGIARSSSRYGKQKEKPLKIYTNSSSSASSPKTECSIDSVAAEP